MPAWTKNSSVNIGNNMNIIKRKMLETGSLLYRTLVFPFKRIKIEIATKSIMKPGSYIMKGTVLKGKNYVGKRTVLSHTELGFGSYVQDKGDFTDTVIGKYTSIGTDVSTVLGRHPVDFTAMHPAFHSTSEALGYTYSKKDTFDETVYLDASKRVRVIIGNDVWIGNHVRIMDGVTIGDGAVVGAGSVVTGDIEPYAIFAGVPAKKIRDRFDKEKKEKLLNLKWWDKDEQWIKDNIPGNSSSSI